MPTKIDLTPAQTAELVALRERHETWSAIADGTPYSRNFVMDRVKRAAAGATELLQPLVRHRALVLDVEDADRAPYPALHPLTWNMLTQGTSLEGTPPPVREAINTRKERVQFMQQWVGVQLCLLEG